MIKRIVFDLDNTLIEWKETYWSWVGKTLEDLHIPFDNVMIQNIKEKINEYEIVCSTFERYEMVAYINEKLQLNLPNTFIDIGLTYLKTAAPKQVTKELEEALSYLYKKYDLVVLTNWFVECQKARLATAGILHYFSSVYGADHLPLKPHPKMFEQVLDGYKKEECLLIGDDMINDGDGACSFGMDVLIYDCNHTHSRNTYRKFSNFKELMNIL